MSSPEGAFKAPSLELMPEMLQRIDRAEEKREAERRRTLSAEMAARMTGGI
jgi:hypothetical protein